MFSLLRKGLIYRDINPDILDHDLDIDAEQWQYDDRDVYRGAFDPRYTSDGLNVYWLYDDSLKRVGLAEHDATDAEVFKALWFHDNPFATLFQDDAWKSTGKTIWSKMTNDAYQDLLEIDFKTVHDQALSSGVLLITPDILLCKPDLYTCESCSKKSLMAKDMCPQASISSLDFNQFSILFVDDDFVIYEKLTVQQHDASAQEQLSTQPELADQPECQDAQIPEAETQEQTLPQSPQPEQ